MKIKLVDGKWIELPKFSKDGMYINEFLKRKMDNILKIQEKGWDAVFLIDGIEGSGKSTLSFICAWYLTHGKLKMRNICEGSIDATEKLGNLPDKSILIIDEGSIMFSSKDTMAKEQKNLIKILNVIRQKRMVLIIVSPLFFDLNKYISVSRSLFLLHVYADRQLNRGRFAYYGTYKKKKLYYDGKKKYNNYVVKSLWNGRFLDFKLPFDDEYQKLKRRSLMEALDHSVIKSTKEIERDNVKNRIYELNKKFPNKYNKNQLGEIFGVSSRTIHTYMSEIPKEIS